MATKFKIKTGMKQWRVTVFLFFVIATGFAIYNAMIAVASPTLISPPARTPLLTLGELQKLEARLLEKVIADRHRDGRSTVGLAGVTISRSPFNQPYRPHRDYTKQACYHEDSLRPEPETFAFCNAETCLFEDGSYCDNRTFDCYTADDRLMVNEKGESVWKFKTIGWNLCLNSDGSPVVPFGEKPYGERIKTGCAYAITNPDADSIGYKDYLVTCDKYRCLYNPSGMAYDRASQTYLLGNGETSKIPPNEFAFVNWACLNTQKANRTAKKYRCSALAEDGANWGCQVCFENGAHVYRDCKYRYNDKGEAVAKIITIIPKLQNQLDELDYLRTHSDVNGMPNPLIANPINDIAQFFNTTKVSDMRQQKAVAMIEQFFQRFRDAVWTDNQLSEQLNALKKKLKNGW